MTDNNKALKMPLKQFVNVLCLLPLINQVLYLEKSFAVVGITKLYLIYLANSFTPLAEGR
jgi:hypothetical protein